MKPTIEGEVVTLRPVTVDDADALWEMVNDPESNDLTHTTATFEYDSTKEWCGSREAASERLDLAIVERATGQLAGEVVLNEYEAADESMNFRISLRGPAWFGRGLGSEATSLIVRYGFEVLGLSRIGLEVLARNPRARRVYEKAGFRETGTSADDGEDWVHMEIRPT